MKRLTNWYFNSLKKQILIPFLAMIMISGLAISYMSYKNSIDLTTEELTITTKEQVKSMDDSFEIFFQKTEDQLDRMSKYPIMGAYDKNPDSIISEFSNTQSSNSEINGLYLGTENDGKTLIFPKAELPADFDPRQREWYQSALKEKNKTIWTEPYTDQATNTLVITAAKAIYDGDELIGVLGVDISIDTLVTMVNQMKFGETGYTVLVDKKGSFVTHPVKEKIQQDISTENIFKKMKSESGSMIEEFEGESQIIGYATNPTTGWRIAGVMEENEVKDRSSSLIIDNIITLLVVFTVTVLSAVFITRSLTNPIKKLQESIRKMADGDFTSKISNSRKDEIGQLAEDTSIMTRNMSHMLEKVNNLSDKVSDSSMTLVASADENSAAANEVAMTMEQIAAGAIDQIEVSQNNENAVKLLADKINDLEAQTSKMAMESENMFKASENGITQVKDLKQQFNETSLISNKMSTAVQSLDARSHDISAIVKTISGIAGQTNLLALNAAIEAARAGEHGKGFAVVANEVKKLAEQTEHSLKEISEIIRAMQTDTTNTVHLIDQVNQKIRYQDTSVTDTENAFSHIASIIASTFSNFDEIKKMMNDMVSEVTRMAGNAEQLNSISQETAAGTEEVSASIEQTNASMEQLNALANELDALSQEMHNEIKTFTF
ncbi:Methyl-accepting chemotaxis protein McpB [Peribacillus sp. Bi96]|uniref:methyl-accepting chemotaxis protein n=1 Tax=Peribacillus sp. Bi96 TaxID=2884273 RepID=UPI001DF70483|nr:methyl-accepting chemotaxis protein [Peribacillus sp. Bi96]CAH0279818.1 Methyl-accepting chemotaxis protein McpB [Peribacillus sp. Bi96]